MVAEKQMVHEKLSEAARELAQVNHEYEPEIDHTYWFDDPQGTEIRLIHVYIAKLPTANGKIRPFYSGRASQAGVPFRSAIALISAEEEADTLVLPPDWGDWQTATRWNWK